MNLSKLYQVAFQQGNAYYAELVGLPADEQCKNATRLSGMAVSVQK